MQLNERFEILQNAFEYWDDHLENIYKFEGWTYSKHDISTWQKAFKETLNFCVIIEKATKKYVGGVCSIIHSSPKILGVGTYFLLPEYRCLGIGLPLWDKCIKRETENKSLIAAPQMSPKYASRDGFDKFFDWNPTKLSILIKDVNPKNLRVDAGLKIKNLNDIDWDTLMEFDRKITGGLERGDYLAEFLSQPGAHNKIITSATNKVLGYCNIRECVFNNLNIGPFYAENEIIASTVLKSVLESIPNIGDFENLKMNVPSNNTTAFNIYGALSDEKFEKFAGCYVQFTDYPMKVPSELVYSITEGTASYC